MKTGRPSKPEGQKVTRHKSTIDGAWLPAGGRSEPVPEPCAELSDRQARLWERLWSTPVAALWGEEDAPGVTRYVVLVMSASAIDDQDVKVLGELRNLEDRYGLNPYSRRLNRWRIEDEGEQPEAVDDDLDDSEFAGLKIVG